MSPKGKWRMRLLALGQGGRDSLRGVFYLKKEESVGPQGGWREKKAQPEQGQITM